MIKLQWKNIFPSLFFLFLLLQCNFFPLQLRHQTSATKLRYLRSSAFYKQPFSRSVLLLFCAMWMCSCHFSGRTLVHCKVQCLFAASFYLAHGCTCCYLLWIKWLKWSIGISAHHWWLQQLFLLKRHGVDYRKLQAGRISLKIYTWWNVKCTEPHGVTVLA